MQRLLALFLVLGVASAQEPAAPKPPSDLASLLPAETLLMVETDDLGGFDRWSQETALGRLWSEPEVQHFVKRLMKSLDPLLDRASGPLGVIGLQRQDLEGIRIRRAGFAVVDAYFETRFELDLVLALEFRQGAEKAAKIVRALRQAAETFLGVGFQEIQLREQPVWQGQFAGREAFVWMQGPRLLVTTTRGRMEQLLHALDAGHPRPLRDAPRFAKVRTRMGADRHVCFGYADVPRIYARATGAAAQFLRGDELAQVHTLWNTLGLDALEGVGVADIPSGTGFRTELALTLKERRGVFALFPQGKPSHRFARHAPANALLYWAERVDLEVFWDGVLRLAEGFGARGKVEAATAQLNERLGIDLRRDLAAALGTDWAGYLGAPPEGGLIPDYAIFVTVRDRPRLEQALDTLVARLQPLAAEHGVSVRPGEAHFRGVRIRFAELSERGDPIPVAPSWAFVDDFCVLALYPQTVKHALLEKRSMQGNEEFRALQRRVPDSAMSVSYLDTKGLVAWLYNTGVPLLQLLQGALNQELQPYGVRLNLQDLPPAEVVTRHLGGAVFYTAVEEDCIRIGCVSPFGAPIVVVPVMAVGVAATLVEKGEREARRQQARRAQRLAEAARARAQLKKLRAQQEKLRAQNRMLRERLRRIEDEVAELKRLLEEQR
ncbi:MAG: hypothetical protein ACYTEZ_12780 [Planctomycetota bacterium]|jgi:hypothetical protein